MADIPEASASSPHVTCSHAAKRTTAGQTSAPVVDSNHRPTLARLVATGLQRMPKTLS
jgi:hypothetical protein